VSSNNELTVRGGGTSCSAVSSSDPLDMTVAAKIKTDKSMYDIVVRSSQVVGDRTESDRLYKSKIHVKFCFYYTSQLLSRS
jgi:hypothetical protein